MPIYCVNKHKDDEGDHEVHTVTCQNRPSPRNKHELGEFSNGADAVECARRPYTPVKACIHCSAPSLTR